MQPVSGPSRRRARQIARAQIRKYAPDETIFLKGSTGDSGARARSNETQAKRLAKLAGIDTAIIRGRGRDL